MNDDTSDIITKREITAAIDGFADLPDAGSIEPPSGDRIEYKLDEGTTYPFFLSLDGGETGIWMTRADLKLLRKLLKAMDRSVDPSQDLA